MTIIDSAVDQRRSLTIAALGTLLTLVAFTSPLATINSTAATLGSDAAGKTWILSSMSIGLSAALLTTGTLADDFGRRRTFVFGVLVLAVASVVCAVSPNTVIFVLARVLQGLGGAAVIASSLGIIAHTHPAGPRRAHASGVWGASLGAGIALGPLLVATLDRLATWRDAYWLVAVAGALLAVAAHRFVRESTSDTPRGLDPAGALLLAFGLSALLAALVEGRQGWVRPLPLILFAVSAVLLIVFVVVEYRSRAAMLDLKLFTQPAFVAATVAAVVTGAGIIALMSFMSGFLGNAYNIDALGAALLLFAWSATSVVTALLARRIPARVTGSVQLAAGLIGVAIGQLAMLGLSVDSTWPRLLPGLLFAGIASGVLNAALGREAVASVPAGRAGMGSGANNTARYVGSAVGVTVVAVLAVPRGTSSPAALVEGWNSAVLFTSAVSVVGALVVLLCRGKKN
ncbi:MFS transporter [Rhodococcus sp. PAMC28707]|uniref:MFS transporter n=1 Tax=unclassified Rhodococcus (in: high G+C Gram-positive bacteria) TaxID=192944 RepID=UPI00109DBB64|nr:MULTISPECIES: MFS transporter [unclassified Rhodococcus (in: high G+C Gram-positive bacteria)]QCB50094.1 MFS transporter [Rhodococcus sp. PAMC28705]QCB58211.1 MFS transporter [Rhodococcus sp. PAMC28707]